MTDMSDHARAVALNPENWLFSALLDMVVAHCSAPNEDRLDSFVGWPANVTAMRLLAEAGFIEITSYQDGRVLAKVLPAAHELTALIEAARQKESGRGG